MNYVLTGAAGHISKPLAEQLLRAGQNVTLIGRQEDHLKALTLKGANIAIGSVEDVEFLIAVFAGADAVYTMFPANFRTHDMKAFHTRIGQNYATAIQANQIRYVVNLSSVGAHLPQGAGHISSLYWAEDALNSLQKVHIRHLRPVYFYTNLFAQIDMIKSMGIMGGNFSMAANSFPVVHPADIAVVAAEELLALNFSGHSVRYIASDETGTDEIAAVLGKSIGKPDLTWVQFTDIQVLENMLQAGFPKEVAEAFVEGFQALHSGKIWKDYWLHHPEKWGVTKLEDFAREFAAVYNEKTPLLAL